ncbi:hypothetical protein N568_0112030 [Lactococcus garvieae TRF1]|uniref:Uncharacterized protein n=1 Tax=Lactococcus garvieae TRF1 TaxID=1380772 RepID=V8ANE4_9LACT|nr:hypothetical protein N568_0112030 [Lactococcus garvieae TRF1]
MLLDSLPAYYRSKFAKDKKNDNSKAHLLCFLFVFIVFYK